MDKQQPLMSNTKKTLLYLLNQEVEQLQSGVMQMNEEDLIRNVSKRKVIYNISRSGQIQLIYAIIALAEYYVNHSMMESAIRILEESREIKVVADSSFLIAGVKMKRKQQEEAVRYYENCLQQEWIQPSEQHRIAAKLEAMTQLQQLYFFFGQRQKLTTLSYQKIRLTRQSGIKFSENYFHALSLADMGVIHEAFGEYPEALQKIDGALALLEGSGQEPSKQIELLKLSGSILAKMGKGKGQFAMLEKALAIVKRLPNCINEKSEIELLQKYIENKIMG